MRVYNNIFELVGKTPLVRLNKLADSSMATVLCKLEYLNPTGSIKDRMALYMIEQAEKAGLLKPGATIIEGTAGNTGLGVAMVAAIKGYRCIFTMPDKMSMEKVSMLKAFGAEVVITPTQVPHESPESYYQVAKRLAKEIPGAMYLNQYFHPDNPKAHYLTTGPEIWEDTAGTVDCFVAAAGTGGTVSGVGKYLKEQAAKSGKPLKVVCPDPEGSIFYGLFYKRQPLDSRSYKVEGIGNDIHVGCLDLEVLDEVRKVSDKDSFYMARKLTREEGLFAGGSAGANVHVALQLARELGPGKTVVTVLPDGGNRYITKFFNEEWMKDNGFVDPGERLGTVGELLLFKGGKVETTQGGEKIADVAAKMNALGISQMPVLGDAKLPHLMIHEVDILQGLLSGRCTASQPVIAVAKELKGILSPSDSISKLEQVFKEDQAAVVIDRNEIVGIITKIDLVRYLATRV